VAKQTSNANSLIKEFTQMRVAELHTYVRNPRRGNIEAIRASLRANLQYNPITVNIGTHTNRPYEVLRGNHTLLAAREEGWETVDVVLVDVDADQARRVVLVDNKLPEMGTYDIEALTAELQELDDLEGTGYTQEDLDKLLYQDEVDDDPKDSEHEEEYNSRWEIVVECDGEDHQRETFERLSQEGYKLRILSL
jgi:hypothetical protein